MAEEAAQAWFERAIAVGLSRLAALQLPGTPPDAATAAACRSVWVDALWPGRMWVQALDEARIAEAFGLLALRVRRWPAPAEFLEALPARPEAIKLPEPAPDPQARARMQAMLAELRAKMRTGRGA